MAEGLARLSSIPPRLLEESTALKATPRRGLAEVRNTPGLGQPSSDKKTARAFGGQTHTPTFAQPVLSVKRKASTAATLTIYEDPTQTEAVPEMPQLESTAESEEDEIDTCHRDPSRDEESLEEWTMTREKEMHVDLVEYQNPLSHWLNGADDDAETIIFGYEDETYSIYAISSESDWSDYEIDDEEGEEGVGRYFKRPYNVGDEDEFERQYAALEISAHESDTEVDTVERDGERENRDECGWIEELAS